MMEWQPIPDFDGYYANQNGDIKGPKKVLRQMTDKWGYKRVTIHGGDKIKIVRVHKLVLLAFVGACPDGMQGCHRDGNPANNHISNLRWDTPKNNVGDSLRNGTNAYGSRSGKAKLNEEKVRNIKLLLKSGVLQSKIAKRYGVSQQAIWSISRGMTWKRVKEVCYD